MKRSSISGDRVLADTGIVRRTAGRTLLFCLFLGLASSARGLADPPNRARVLEARGAFVAVAADSGALRVGLRLSFSDRRHVRAAGVVTGVLEGTLASVRLESGSLDHVHALKKLRVLVEPTEPPPLATIRVGIPAGARRAPISACVACTLAVPFDWRVEPLGASAWRAVHDAVPETLIVRAFRDADDEEIAWERREVDVAVFWPGELTATQRARLGSADLVVGPRARETAVAARDSTWWISEPGGAPRLACPILASPAGHGAIARLGAATFADLPACTR